MAKLPPRFHDGKRAGQIYEEMKAGGRVPLDVLEMDRCEASQEKRQRRVVKLTRAAMGNVVPFEPPRQRRLVVWPAGEEAVGLP